MRLFLDKQQFSIPKYTLYDHKNFGFFFKELEKLSGPVALDLETSGLDPFLPTSYIRSISLCGENSYCFAIDIKELSDKVRGRLWTWLSEYDPGFIMHNAVFDATWCMLHGKSVKVHRCSSVMFRNTSNEGYIGQRWKLKTAMEEVLGWSEVNNIRLKEWLSSNKLTEGDMHLAPWSILGPYNALDAGGTYQLFKLINEKIQAAGFTVLDEYWNEDIDSMIEVLVEQYIRGIQVDSEKLSESLKELKQEVDFNKSKFFNQDNIRDFIKEFNELVVYNKECYSPLSKNKDGTTSLRWLKHIDKINLMKTQNHFNLNSPKHLQWLFFDKLKKTPVRFVEHKKNGRKIKTNNPSVDKKALPLLGVETRPLLDYRKSRGVLEDLESIQSVQQDCIIHPFLTVSGTVTGRLSGGLQGDGGKRFNIQNIVNDKRVYNCLTAPKEWKIIYMDFASLEPHVLCEFSKDQKLRELYLENKPHDLYLWFGANTTLFGPLLKDYPNDNPTSEVIRVLKKRHHELRKALKIIVLGLGYNMGEKKLMEDVNDQTELTITMRDARRIKQEYFRFFPGITRFMEKLDELYVQNDEKFIVNGRGRPLFTLMDDRSKLCNKFVQSTGHDVTQLLIHNINKNRKKYDIELVPYDVDKHDSTAWIFKDTKENEELAVKVYRESLQELNDTLPWEVKMSGEIKIGTSLGEFIE